MRETGTFRYDAFISYRHVAPDAAIAERLHRVLEQYVVPRVLVRQGLPRRLSRVFRDREELPTSESLSEGIREALEQSRFLIVVCSPRALDSKWVAKEIDTFIALGRRDRILTLLVDGDPETSFPPALREIRRVERDTEGVAREVVEEVSPLAADVRAGSIKQAFRLLETEKLRLLAPVVGCAFDDLKRRHYHRRVRRLQIIAASILAGLLLGGGGAWWYWAAHYRVQTKYFANFVKKWGAIVGQGALTPEEVSHRQNSLRCYVRGGRIEAYDVVNGVGEMTVNNTVITFLDDASRLDDATRDFHYEFEFSTAGAVTKEKAYDRAHRLVWEFVYNETADVGHYADKRGYATPLAGSGAAYVAFTRSPQGYDIAARFTDSHGNPKPNQNGAFGWTRDVGPQGELITTTNIDANGAPMADKTGVVRARYTNDRFGNATEIWFETGGGEALPRKDGVARETWRYDAYGNFVDFKLWDAAGNAKVGSDGYAEQTRAYDPHGNMIEINLLLPGGAPVRVGPARLTYAYDARGDMTRETRWFAAIGGTSARAWSYDPRGYRTSEEILDGKGHLVAGADGVARATWTRDADGNKTLLSFFDAAGQPLVTKDGYSSIHRAFDAHGNITDEDYLGARGEPVPHRDGYARVHYVYDERGNLIEVQFLDVAGQLMDSKQGYARAVLSYDENGRQTQLEIFNLAGRSVGKRKTDG